MSEISLNEDFEDPSREEWLALVDKVLKGSAFDKRLVSRNADGLPIAPLYTRADTIAEAQNAVPGKAPFQRGSAAIVEDYGWDIRQSHGDLDPAATNKELLQDLSGGVTSFTL